VESEKKSSRENSAIIGDQQFSFPEQPDKLTQGTLFNSGPDNIALNNVHAHYESVDFPQSTDPRWSQGPELNKVPCVSLSGCSGNENC